MEFVQVIAHYLDEGVKDDSERIIIQCGIDPHRRFISEGEWYGVVQSGGVSWPVNFKNDGEMIYGDKAFTSHSTNLRSVLINTGKIIKVFPSKEDVGGDVQRYCITRIKFFQSPHHREFIEAEWNNYNKPSWRK